MNKLIRMLVISVLSMPVYAGEMIDESLDASATGDVSIRDPHGNLEIRGWNKNTVTITGELSDGAEGYIFERQGSEVIFEVEYPNYLIGRSRADDESKLIINLPEKSRLDAGNVNPDIQVYNVKGGAEIDSVNGNILAENVEQRVSLETVNGNITSRNLNGKIEIQTINGAVDDSGSSGEIFYGTVQGGINSNSNSTTVNASAVNGSIDLTLGKIDELILETVNGSIDAKLELNPKGEVSVTSVNGSIELTFNKDISAKFNINTFAGGSIINNLTSDKVNKARFGPGQNISFNKDGGSGDVDIDTVSGRITIGD